jgi:hypothetical protein
VKTSVAASPGLASENGGRVNQGNEIYNENRDADLGTSEKILHGAPLSGRIYKICTLLSTDIVENTSAPAVCTAREALLGAALAAWADSSWYGVDDEGMATG